MIFKKKNKKNLNNCFELKWSVYDVWNKIEESDQKHF